jgi:2,4-diaminopentanoate dehydrogenase
MALSCSDFLIRYHSVPDRLIEASGKKQGADGMVVVSGKKTAAAVWGEGEVGQALRAAIAARDDMQLAAGVADIDALLEQAVPLVILTPGLSLAESEAEALIVRLLAAGKRVISLLPLSVESTAIQAACQQGQSAFYATGLFPHLMLDRMALILGRALQDVEHVRVVQSVDVAAVPSELMAELAATGIGQQNRAELLKERKTLFAAVAPSLLRSLGSFNSRTGADMSGKLRTTCELTVVKAEKDIVHGAVRIPRGAFTTVQAAHQCFVDGVLRFTCEEHWYLGRERAVYGEDMPYGNIRTPYAFSVHVVGAPSRLDTQITLESAETGINPLLQALLMSVLSAIPAVLSARPGIVQRDATPRYQQDARLPLQASVKSSSTASAGRRKRIVIWGPGEIGGAVTRAALTRPDVEIVGAKVFSPHKHGRDLGELVGIAPIGIKATRATEEILALKPDCVVMAPQPRAIVEGLDDDVLLLLKAGINVITSAAYHNVSMPNWLVSAQTPTALLREVATTKGMARNRREKIIFGVNAKVLPLFDRSPFAKALTPLLDKVLKPAVQKEMPTRATPEKLLAACREGNASLHGTGVHPTFMAERVGMSLAGLVDEVQHMRFVEAADFSFMPDGMWGGLEMLGFGRPASELDENYLIAKAGDFYYGDVIGNAAHLLYGVPSTEVRVQRSFRAIPAQRDFKVGSMTIRRGHAAALHMVHKGFIGNHHFFTNEECWYLGPEQEFRGDDLPFGNFATPISYTVDVQGKSQRARMQLSMDGTGRAAELLHGADTGTADQRCALGQQMRKEGVTNPITNATAMAILDAVSPVCEMGAGVIIDDVCPAFMSRVQQ